jgi:hypothetical protein
LTTVKLFLVETNAGDAPSVADNNLSSIDSSLIHLLLIKDLIAMGRGL